MIGWLLAGLLGLALIVLLLYWLLVVTEGVYLGRRLVVWLYDLTAHSYDAIKDYDPEAERLLVIWPLLLRLGGRPAPVVLDVATGTGRLPFFLLEEVLFNGRVIGLDPASGMLVQARAKLRPFGDRAGLVQQAAGALPFADGAFDAVSCLEALEFLPSDTVALREMVRVLRPGGALLVTRRRGWEARAFLGRYHSREAFEALLGGLGLERVETRLWQVEYDLVFAAKPVPDSSPRS